MTRNERENCIKIKDNFQSIMDRIVIEQKRVNRLGARFNWLKDEVKCLDRACNDLLTMAMEIGSEIEKDDDAEDIF